MPPHSDIFNADRVNRGRAERESVINKREIDKF